MKKGRERRQTEIMGTKKLYWPFVKRQQNTSDMKTMPHYKFFSNSHRSFFSINFLHLTTLVGYILIYSLCYLGIIAALGFAALLPVR